MIPTLIDIIRGLLDGSISHEQARLWLAQHEALQDDGESLGDVPYERARTVMDVLIKCVAQDDRWGPRRYPSFNPVLTANADVVSSGVAQYHGIMDPKHARLFTQNEDNNRELSWMAILVEEVAKLTERGTPEAVRDQLIDVAGVAVQWAQQLTPEESEASDGPDHA